MATVSPPAPSATPPLRGVQPLRAGEGHSFFWRKLHSLTGIIPIGAFLIEHIVSNFETVNGPLAYAKQVLFLNSLPLVRVLEWAFIFIPLAYHAIYGVFIAVRGRNNVNVSVSFGVIQSTLASSDAGSARAGAGSSISGILSRRAIVARSSIVSSGISS